MPGLVQVIVMNHGHRDQAQPYTEGPEMKSIILLAIALFLISAPAPDARDIAEMTHDFIVPEESNSLRASEIIDTPEPAPYSFIPAAKKTDVIKQSAESNPGHDPSESGSKSS